jgi:PilZ domain
MAPAPTERRRWARYPTNMGTFWQTVSAQEICYSARVQDISQGGVRLLVNQRFEPGTLLRILLNKAVEARLVHATPAGENKWALGCEFSLILSKEEIQNLLKSSTSP